MQELFFTILTIWVLFKIFGASNSQRFTFNSHKHYHPPQESKREGEISVEKKNTPPSRKRDDQGEYVDFEEIKD